MLGFSELICNYCSESRGCMIENSGCGREKRRRGKGERQQQHRRKFSTAKRKPVTGRIYVLVEGFPISLVTQRRRKHIILKNIGLVIKLRLLGGGFPSDAAAILPSCVPFHHPPAKDEFRPV